MGQTPHRRRKPEGEKRTSTVLARWAPMSSSHAPIRVWVFVVVLFAASAAGAIAARHLGHASQHVTLPWPAVAAALVAASMLTVTVPSRGGTFTIGLLEVSIVVGAVYLTPIGLVLAVLCGQVAIGLARRRPPSRTAFNAASFACAALAALAVYRGLLDHASPVSARGWLAACIAVIAADLVMNTTLAIVIPLNTRRSPRSEVRVALRSTAVSLPLVLILVLIAVDLTWVSRVGDLLLIGLGALALLAQRSTTELRRRYSNLEKLYRFTENTRGVMVVDDILLTLLRHARDVLGAGLAEFTLSEAEGFAKYGLDADNQLVRRARYRLGLLERLVLRNGTGLLATRTDRRVEIRAALEERGFQDAVAATTSLGAGAEGILVVADREGALTFDEDDLRLVEVLTSHGTAAIRGGRLLEELKLEAIARRHEALHDGLTGLANRTLLHKVVGDTLSERSAGCRVAVMLLDLDGFKEINDTLGHHTGDSVLREVAIRLEAAVANGGRVARLGGDEFALLFGGMTDLGSIRAQAESVLQEISRPILLDGLVLSIRASIGVSVAPDHGEDCSVLLRRADVAMYTAKSSGTGAQIYDPASDHYTTRRLTLATELGAEPQANDLEVWYQPQADLATGAIVECEALSRWTHGVFGQILPDEFIPLAEQSGSIGPLTWRVLEAAIARLQNWHSAQLQVGMAVNIAARSLLEVALVQRLAEMLGEAGLDPSWLTLELTESSIVGDETRSGRALAALGELGVRIALDDFGTGHSSLTRLRRLPINVVKIDKSFVGSMSVDPGDLAIVRSTVELAHSLGHVVVAEGVEDRVTWDRLADLGCDRAQGFYLARPMPAMSIDEWLRKRVPMTGSRVEVEPEAEAEVIALNGPGGAGSPAAGCHVQVGSVLAARGPHPAVRSGPLGPWDVASSQLA